LDKGLQLDSKFEESGASENLREAILAKYDIVSKIGTGSYGYVAKGICKITARPVALKIMVG